MVVDYPIGIMSNRPTFLKRLLDALTKVSCAPKSAIYVWDDLEASGSWSLQESVISEVSKRRYLLISLADTKLRCQQNRYFPMLKPGFYRFSLVANT